MTDIMVQVLGLPALDAKLRDLEPKLARSILRAAVRRAANIVRDAARERVPGKTGLLRRSIRTQLRRGKPGQTRISVGVFGASRSQLKKGLDPFYARFVERGHRIVPRGPTGKRVTGQRTVVEARPFLLPALVASRTQVVAVLREEIARRIGELIG